MGRNNNNSDYIFTKVGKDVLQLGEHHGAVAVLVVQLAQVHVVLVAAAAVGGGLGLLDLLHDLVELGELLALFIGHSQTDTDLMLTLQYC